MSFTAVELDFRDIEVYTNSKRVLLQTSTCRQQKYTIGCQSYKPKAQGGVQCVSAWSGFCWEKEKGERED